LDKLRIITLTPPGFPDPSLAIAGSRAGEWGVLDLEYTYNKKIAKDSIKKLSTYARNDYGIKLNLHDNEFFAEITSSIPENLRLVILACADAKDLKQVVKTLHKPGLTVLLECTSLKEAQTGKQAGVDGVIAKGHEAGGRVSDETTFVLLQRFLKNLSLPVYAQGGIGLHTAAACYAAGAAGVVLDSQLTLTRESPLPETIKTKITAMDGNETICIGEEIGECYRVCSRMGMDVVKELHEISSAFAREGEYTKESVTAWRRSISEHVGWNSPERQLFLLGQDIAFAAPLAQCFKTVGGVLEAMLHAADTHCRTAQTCRLLAEGSPLANSHGTRYPIVQGPMARVSDNADFVSLVAQEGALPFVAAAWMREHELDSLLRETSALLKEDVWGIGLLGFLPSDLYQEQLKTVIMHRPPFALIAGGQPNQAKALEQEGIATYLHVPSPGLLRLFLDNGIRRFVFEGRESGGHVGPLCSFVLWENMISLLLKSLESSTPSREYHVLFAGGIHDSLSASMVAVMAAPLAERGVRVGVQLGSAYLFTQESVETGAISASYQQKAIKCHETTLLETNLGHANRCIDTPYSIFFKAEKQRMLAEGKSSEEIKDILEKLNLGRLRIAAKGSARNPKYGSDPKEPKLMVLTEEEQDDQGMYMIGQLAGLRKQAFSINALHQDITVRSSERIDRFYEKKHKIRSTEETNRPSDIAIIGMACLLPDAPNVQKYWENILNKVNAIREVPKSRWDHQVYYDPDPKTKDKIYSKWGAFLDDIFFDPMQYGMPPNSLRSIEPIQILTLETVRWAIEDAGYTQRPFARKRTSVILGISGTGDLGQRYSFRTSLPTFFGDYSQDIVSHFENTLPEWTEDSFPGILTNVTAGRVANRFDLGGTNFTVDAACASSLTAVYLAVKELESRTCDMVIVGGADCMQNPFTYQCFSETQALSPRGQCNSLDESADGIVLGEGFAVMILKRLAEAERDGDHVYAVIKGVGAASDGRDKSLTAPGRKGQMRALRRAYAKAGFSPATVELIEAHATGTTVGDRVEIEALSQVFKNAGAGLHNCAVGTIKSMIGHTKSTAGVAGLMKTCLALHHKVLPATLGVKKPNPGLLAPDSPFYVNTETRPWIHHATETPRRAGVSALGFGGTNFHVVLEEYSGDYLKNLKQPSFQEFPCELLVWKGFSREELLETISPLEKALANGAKPSLGDLAFTYALKNEQKGFHSNKAQMGLAVVASSLEDLTQKLDQAREALNSSKALISDSRGIYFAEQPLAIEGKVAFLFPGQGSQYVNMFADLCVQFPEIRNLFEESDRILERKLPKPLSTFIFPPPVFSEKERQSLEKTLAQTWVAQPAMGTANLAMFHLLESLGIKPDMVAGHSYGEYVALCAAGVLNEDDLVALSEARGRFIVEAAGSDPGTMAAIQSDTHTVSENIEGMDGIWIANINAPNQIVITGTHSAVAEAVERFKQTGIKARTIPVACAFHSPIVSPACQRLSDFLLNIRLSVPHIEVYSNTTAKKYPSDTKAIAHQLVQHLIKRVEFVREIEAMYEDGARIFVEVGPGRVLSGLVDQTIGDRTHLTTISNQAGRSDLTQLQHLLGQLIVHGVPVKMDRIHRGRSLKCIETKALEKETHQASPSSTTWVVNGTRVKPLKEVFGPEANKKILPMQVTVSSARTANRISPEGNEGQISTPQIQSEVGTEIPTAPAQPGSANTKFSTGSYLSDDGNSQVMIQYQRLMQQFLEAQKNVMMSFFHGQKNNAELPTARIGETLPESSFPDPSQSAGIQVDTPHEQYQMRSQESLSEQMPLHLPITAETPSQEDVASSSDRKTFLDRDRLTSLLLEIVSERTGYPQEMLDLDLSMEAELGIDSIKRVEILGQYLQIVFDTVPDGPPEHIEGLNQVKTLRNVIDLVEESKGFPGKSESKELPPSSANQAPEPSFDFIEKNEIPRFTLTVTDAPPASRSVHLPLSRVLIVIDDGRGIAETLTNKLESRGYKFVIAKCLDINENIAPDCYPLKNISPEAIEELLQNIRQNCGPIGGLINLLPLKKWSPYQDMDMAEWKDRLQLETKTLFHFLKLLENDLNQAAKEDGACVVSATGMGGNFASGPTNSHGEFFPGHGAISGFLKTLDMEWTDVRVKVVDLCLDEPISSLADHLFAEIESDDDLVEVGYHGSRRIYLGLAETTLLHRTETYLEIDSNWVVLVTGGARGITAEVSREIARRYRPIMILAGRSPLPPEEEPQETARFVLPQELKNAIIAGMKGRGESVSLPEVEAAYNQLYKEREIRSNLTSMRQAGAQASYCQIDVRNEQQFSDLIDDIYQTYGRIDAVIHGAGIIEDKLFREKTWASFERVFGTKTESVFVLSKKLRPDTLKFMAFFSSVAGRFGNVGQSDYTAANDVLNKLACYLDERWPARVLSINWGPWAGGGMASEEVQRQFASRGVDMVSPEEGPRYFDIELFKGFKGEAEVVVGEGPWRKLTYLQYPVSTEENALPLFQTSTEVSKANGSLEIIRRFDPSQDLYLLDHCIDGKPVLPAAMAIEFMTEASQLGWPGWNVTAIENIRVLKGIVLEKDSVQVRLLVRPEVNMGQQQEYTKLGVTITDIQRPELTFYKSTVVLSRSLPSSKKRRLRTNTDLHPFWTSTQGAYDKWLFHGPIFQCIQSIQGISKQAMVATLIPSSPSDCLATQAPTHWLMDPVVLDGGLQLALLWARNYLGITVLPSSFKAVHIFRPFHLSSIIRCHLQVLEESGKHTVYYNIYFMDTEGLLLGMIERVEATGSSALNRLPESHPSTVKQIGR